MRPLISKQALQNYRRNLREIESINYQLERLYKEQERIKDTTVHDSVQMSNPEYPYNAQHYHIEGVTGERDKAVNYIIRQQIKHLDRLQKSLQKATAEVALYIESIEDADTKSIITYRVLYGDSWKVVAKKMGAGYTDEAVRQKYSRHFRQQ